jgi:hypothetical protein
VFSGHRDWKNLMRNDNVIILYKRKKLKQAFKSAPLLQQTTNVAAIAARASCGVD